MTKAKLERIEVIVEAGDLEDTIAIMIDVDKCRVKDVEKIDGGRFRITAECPQL